MVARRSFLKSACVGLIGTTFGGVVSGRRQHQRRIVPKVERRLSNRDFDGALSVLDRMGVDYISRKQEIQPQDGPSTQAWYGNPNGSNSYVGTVVYETRDNEPGDHRVSLVWDLARGGARIDYPEPRDAVVIAWEGSQFGYVDDTLVNECKAVFNLGQEYEESVDMDLKKPLLDDPKNATWIAIKDKIRGPNHQSHYPDEMWGKFGVSIRQQEPEAGRVATRYEHTWSPFGIGDTNILENVSVGKGPVSISVNVPAGSDSWNKDFSEDVSLN